MRYCSSCTEEVHSKITAKYLIWDVLLVVGQILWKIIQEKTKFKQNQFPKIKNFSKINETINKVNNSELKSSLNNFLKAFNERKK